MITEVGVKIEAETGVLASKMFGIGDQLAIMRFLRDNIYSDKVGAIVREYICNAIDAHVQAGKRDVPISVHLPNVADENFRVIDHGPGLSHEDMEVVFVQYGTSTKRETNDQVGCFGLGCKSAFCMSPIFEVVSRHGGTRRTYSAYLEDSGVGRITLISEEPCDDTGLEVSVPIASQNWDYILNSVEEFFSALEIPVEFSGRLVKPRPVIARGGGWVSVEASSRGRVFATIGSVSYPIGQIIELIRTRASRWLEDRTDERDDEDDEILHQDLSDDDFDEGDARMLSHLIPIKDSKHYGLSLYLQLPIGSVDISVSRELLEVTPKTIRSVTQAIVGLDGDIRKELTNNIKGLKNWYAADRYLDENSIAVIRDNILVSKWTCTDDLVNEIFPTPEKKPIIARWYQVFEGSTKIRTFGETKPVTREFQTSDFLVVVPDKLKLIRQRLSKLCVTIGLKDPDCTGSPRTRRFAVVQESDVEEVSKLIGIDKSDFFDLSKVEYTPTPRARAACTTSTSTSASGKKRQPWVFDVLVRHCNKTTNLRLGLDFIKTLPNWWLEDHGSRYAATIAMLTGEPQFILAKDKRIKNLIEKEILKPFRLPEILSSDGVKHETIASFLMANTLGYMFHHRIGKLKNLARGTKFGAALDTLIRECLPFKVGDVDGHISDDNIRLSYECGGIILRNQIYQSVDDRIAKVLKPFPEEVALANCFKITPTGWYPKMNMLTGKDSSIEILDKIFKLSRKVDPPIANVVDLSDQYELDLDLGEVR